MPLTYNPTESIVDRYKNMGLSDKDIEDVVIPTYSSYIQKQTQPIQMTAETFQEYLKKSPEQRQFERDLNAFSGQTELDLRVRATLLQNEEKKRTETITPKINILKRIPYHEHKVDISFLHGVGISTHGTLDTGDSDDIGSNVPRINIRPTVNSNQQPLIVIKPTNNNNVMCNQLTEAPPLPLPEVETTLPEVQAWMKPLPAIINEHGFMTVYDETGVNRCALSYKTDKKEGDYRGCLFGSSDSDSLISPSSNMMSMSPGYNDKGIYDAFGYNSNENYLGYGDSGCRYGIGGNVNNIYNGNGGIFGGIYRNGINPWVVQQQKEAEEKARIEQIEMEKYIQKSLYRSVCSYNDLKPDQRIIDSINGDYEEDFIEELGPKARIRYEKIKQDEAEFNHRYMRLCTLETQPWYVNEKAEMWRQHYVGYIEKEKQKCPDNVGLVEWLEKYAPAKLCEAYEMKQEEQDRKDIRNLCDDDLYNRELEKKRMEMMSLTPDGGDTEVYIPGRNGGFVSSSEAESRERRKKFLSMLVSSRSQA